MLFQAGFNEKMRQCLWWLAVDYANDCSNVTATTRQDSYAYKHFWKKDSNLVHYMQPFGRLGYATIQEKFGATWKEKAIKAIFVGHAKTQFHGRSKRKGPLYWET